MKFKILTLLAVTFLMACSSEKSSEDSFDEIAGSDKTTMVSNASNELVDQVIK